MQLPGFCLTADRLEEHLQRTFDLHNAKNDPVKTWDDYLANLHALDWYLACACLDGDAQAWKQLFAARTYRVDALLVDALRARAERLYPRDEERQESAVTEFWSQLLAGDRSDSPGVLARYDGQRPLVPWLIRVFQNWHLSQLRHRNGLQPLPGSDVAQPLPEAGDSRWHDAFRLAAREWFSKLSEQELLILGLRLRYRLSQREAAKILGAHEGTISRQTDQLRDRCLDDIGKKMRSWGWSGDGLEEFIRTEMGGLLLDEPRLSADRLASLIAAKGKKPPHARS
jgi:RNA polymerase sigma factor (sigma-70 family)